MDITGIEPNHIAQLLSYFDKEEVESVEVHRIDSKTVNVPEGESWLLYESGGWFVWPGPAEVLNTLIYIKLPTP